jgi:hypothetical protein
MLETQLLERAKYFQSVQIWPLSDDLNYEGWLKNFKGPKEKEIGSLILDFFIYISAKLTDQLLISSINKASTSLSQIFPDWNHFDLSNRCIYSYIPGETINISDSGFSFIRKLKEVIGIPEERFVDYTKLYDKLDGKKPTPVIFVDDFVGTGEQCSKAWNRNRTLFKGMTLNDMAIKWGHVFVYAPLIVNHIGFNRIKIDCPNLLLTPAHILGPEYNLFNSNCICWKNDIKLFKKGVGIILKKSREIGIPSTKGMDTQDVKGFWEQGLALKFEHGAPDAIPSFFYWCHDKWTPLFKKNYER